MKLINAAVKSVNFCGVDVLQDAMDDGSPYSVQEVEVVGAGGNAAGNIVAYKKPTLAMVSVTVGPGSQADSALKSKLKKLRPGNGGGLSNNETFTVVGETGKVYDYSNGILVSGGGGTMQADGKLGGVTYTAAFYNLG